MAKERAQRIAKDLQDCAGQENFSVPESLKGCKAVQMSGVLNQAVREIRGGRGLMPYDRFFDILFSEKNWRRWLTAYNDCTPDEFRVWGIACGERRPIRL